MRPVWLRQQGWIFGFYLLLAIIITFPMVIAPASQFLGGDTGDSYEMARHVWWFNHALRTGQDPFWQSNLGYPDGFSGVTLQANVLQFFPMWLFAYVLPLATAFNFTILLTLALNGWTLYILLRYLLAGDHEPAPAQQFGALLGGAVFLAAPPFQGHLFEGHAGLLVMYPVPLYLWALFHLVTVPRWDWRWFGLSVLFFFFSPSGHMLQLIYVVLPITALFLLGRMILRDWIGVRRVIAVGAMSTVLLGIFLFPVIRETLAQPVYTQAGGFVRYSADLLSLVTPAYGHVLWGNLPYTHTVLGTNLGEGYGYIGILVALLAGVGLVTTKAARWWGWLALLVWVLALGPLLKLLNTPLLIPLGEYESYLALPWAWVQNLPFFSLARSPGRFLFTLAVALAVLAGYGAAHLAQRWRLGRGQWALFAVLVGVILFDYQAYFPMPTRPAEIPAAVYDLREREDVRAVFDLPYDHLLAAKDALYLQTAHQKPLIAGQVSRETPVNPAKLRILQETLDPALLKSRGADIVILHKRRAMEMDALDDLLARLSENFPPPLYEDDEIAIYETPNTDRPTTAQTWSPQLVLGLEQEFPIAVYTPQVGWWNMTALLAGVDREVTLWLDDTPLHRWYITGSTTVRAPLPLELEGFYRVRFTIDPPCPVAHHPTLVCQGVQIGGLDLVPLTTGVVYDRVRFGRGVELMASYVPPTVEDTLHIQLWWHFDEARIEGENRFVHILDSNGVNVLQNDASFVKDAALDNLPANSDWAETVEFDVSNLPAGKYTVQVGWYALPEVIRFPVLTENVRGGQDNAPEIGQFTR